MTADERLDPFGPYVRAVRWRSGDRLAADVTYRSNGQPVARVYGPRTDLARRVGAAVSRRAGRFPASIEWYDVTRLGDEPEPGAVVTAGVDGAQVAAALRLLAEQVELQAPTEAEIDSERTAAGPGYVEVRLSWR